MSHKQMRFQVMSKLAARGVKKIITTSASGLLDSGHFAGGIEELPTDAGGVKGITGGASVVID